MAVLFCLIRKLITRIFNLLNFCPFNLCMVEMWEMECDRLARPQSCHLSNLRLPHLTHLRPSAYEKTHQQGNFYYFCLDVFNKMSPFELMRFTNRTHTHCNIDDPETCKYTDQIINDRLLTKHNLQDSHLTHTYFRQSLVMNG